MDNLLNNWSIVLGENGQLVKNGNNIVLQNISNNEIGYLEDNLSNRNLLKLPLELPENNGKGSPFYYLGEDVTDNSGNQIINQDENENNQQDYCSRISDSSEIDIKKIKWTAKYTKLLIDTRLAKDKAFSKSKCKKINLWQDIATKINEELDEGNYQPVTAEECDNKFRNLLKTYKANKKKQKSTGEGAICWEFFEDFDKVLGCKVSIEPPENTLVDTMDFTDKEYNTETELLSEAEHSEYAENLVAYENSLDPRPSSTNSTRTSIGKARKKIGRNVLQFKEYLYLKNKREEERDKKRELFERERWQEEKELSTVKVPFSYRFKCLDLTQR